MLKNEKGNEKENEKENKEALTALVGKFKKAANHARIKKSNSEFVYGLKIATGLACCVACLAFIIASRNDLTVSVIKIGLSIGGIFAINSGLNDWKDDRKVEAFVEKCKQHVETGLEAYLTKSYQGVLEEAGIYFVTNKSERYFPEIGLTNNVLITLKIRIKGGGREDREKVAEIVNNAIKEAGECIEDRLKEGTLIMLTQEEWESMEEQKKAKKEARSKNKAVIDRMNEMPLHANDRDANVIFAQNKCIVSTQAHLS